jgi:hypothetical protein
LILIGVSDVVITAIFELRPPSMGHCDGIAGVFSQTTFVRETAFTAHVIRAPHQANLYGKWVGCWALVAVQEQLSGWHLSRFAILTKSYFYDGDDYFVEGRRPKGLLTRFLPIVEIGGCSRTGPLPDAGIALRLLKSTFPKNDVRIIGRVDRWQERRPLRPFEPPRYVLVQGAEAAITGPTGTTIATTDKDGIYDMGGLPPGNYSVRLQTNSGSQNVVAHSDWSSDLKPGEVAEHSFSFR